MHKEPALIESLADEPDDESNGREAIRGFSFQVWWATCRAFELLKTHSDFLVVLEFKQDVVVMDSVTAPSCLAFYQLKKNEGFSAKPWSVAELIVCNKERDKKPPRSVLGKLYQHRPRFPGTKVTLAFVTNTGFSYGTPKQECEELHLVDLPAATSSEVKKVIAEDLGIPEASIDLLDFRLERTHMSFELPQRWAGGILDEVETAAVLPFDVRNKGAVAQIVAAEVLARAGKRTFAKDFAKLRTRGISRAELMAMLMQSSSSVRHSSKTVAEGAIQQLRQEAYPYRAVDKMEEEIARVCVDLSDRNNASISKLAKASAEGHALLLSQGGTSFGGDLDALVTWLRAKDATLCAEYNSWYLHLVAALTLKDAHELRVLASTADTQ